MMNLMMEKKRPDWGCPCCSVAIGNVQPEGREFIGTNKWLLAFYCTNCNERWNVTVNNKTALVLFEVFFDDEAH